MLTVDGIDGVHQSVSLVTVNSVEQVMLDVVSDFGDDYTSLLYWYPLRNMLLNPARE